MPPGFNSAKLGEVVYETMTKPRIVRALQIIAPNVIDKIGTAEQDEAVGKYLLSKGYHEKQGQLTKKLQFYEKNNEVFGMYPRDKTPSPGFHYSYAKLQTQERKDEFILATEEHYQPKIFKSIMEPILQAVGGLAIIGGFVTFLPSLAYALVGDAPGITQFLPITGSMASMFGISALTLYFAENLDKKEKKFNEFNPRTGVNALETIAGIDYRGCGFCSACD